MNYFINTKKLSFSIDKALDVILYSMIGIVIMTLSVIILKIFNIAIMQNILLGIIFVIIAPAIYSLFYILIKA
jgi:uncharacterized membrane protein YjjP (DUF1212 family)